MGIVHAKEYQPGNQGIATLPRPQVDHNSYERVDSNETQLDTINARVDKIHINGLGRTKDDVVQDTVKDLFTARSIEDVLVKAHQVRAKLDTLGCFRNIGVFIDVSKGPSATKDGLEVTFYVKELKRVVGGVNTQVGNNEGSVVVGLRAPNLFGRGEKLQCEYSYGSKRTNNFNVAYIKPLRGYRSPVLTTSVYQATQEFQASGYKQLDRGLTLDFGFNSLPFVKHNFQYDASIRELNVMSRSTSFDVREQTGLSLKSALRHILSIDLRDEPIFPSCGSLFQVTSEFAGLGGDVGFVKNEAFVQGNYSLYEDYTVQTSFCGGAMHKVNDDMKITMSDMFYLGGPLSLRGFEMRGVGPHSDGDALGATWYWAAGLHLFTPLPFRPGRGGFGELFRSHLFVNAGNIGSLESGRPITELIQQNIRIAYGVGVAIRLGQMARVELNYCVPHAHDKSDSPVQGVQFGIGIKFL